MCRTNGVLPMSFLQRHSSTMDSFIPDECEKLRPKKCEKHTGKKLFGCDSCNKEIISNMKLQNYMLTNIGGKPFICKVCGKAFSLKINLVMHKCSHNGQKSFHCEKSNTNKTKNDELIENRLNPIKKELSESFTCDICGEDFPQKSSLAMHSCTPVINKLFQYEGSNGKVSESNNLLDILPIPIKTSIYKCHICKWEFTRKYSCIQHVRSHSRDASVIKFHKTDSFFKPSNKNYSCDTCQKEFTAKGSLFQHMRTHTGEKPYECGMCRKEFAQKGTLRRHMQIHTGRKPYKCNLCTRQFTQSCTLIRHMRVHTGEKPYKCSVCEKRFSQNGTLLQHVRLHTGEKPYKCGICNKAFSYNNYLNTHVRMHSTEKGHN